MTLEIFATKAAEAAVGSLATRAVGASTSVIGAFLRWRPRLTDGGTPSERTSAAAAFRRAVIEYRTSLALLAGLRVQLIGAAVTLPLVIKQIHRLPSLSTELSDAALNLCTVGSERVIEQANVVAQALSSAAHEFGAGPAKTRGERVTRALDEVDNALGEFTSAVRADCGHMPLPVLTEP